MSCAVNTLNEFKEKKNPTHMYYQCYFQQESCRVDEKELHNNLHEAVY